MAGRGLTLLFTVFSRECCFCGRFSRRASCLVDYLLSAWKTLRDDAWRASLCLPTSTRYSL
jgi:hypothetical protein